MRSYEIPFVHWTKIRCKLKNKDPLIACKSSVASSKMQVVRKSKSWRWEEPEVRGNRSEEQILNPQSFPTSRHLGMILAKISIHRERGHKIKIIKSQTQHILLREEEHHMISH